MRHLFRQVIRATAACAVLLSIALGPNAHAARVGLRGYGKADGLGDLNNTCLDQAGDGSILVCSNRGLFDYEGERFKSLGAAHGLREGGIIYDLARDRDGRLYVRYPDAIYVSNPSRPGIAAVQALRFQQVLLGGSYFDHHHNQIVAWRGGVATLVNGVIENITFDAAGNPVVHPIGYSRSAALLLKDSNSVRSVRGALWTTTASGHVCRAVPGRVRCLGPGDGLPDLAWHDVEAGEDGAVVARADMTAATIDPVTNIAVTEELPCQEQWPAAIRPLLGFFRDSLGRLVTQASVGLIVRTTSGWKPLVFGDDTVADVVTSVMADRRGQLWLGTLGHGVYRVLGYGTWEGFAQGDGLSDNIVWSTVRDRVGHLWVATDKAVDEFQDVQGQLTPIDIYAGSSYAMSLGPDGKVWASDGVDGVRIFDPTALEQTTRLKVPPVDEMVKHGRRVWIGTERGLFFADVPAVGAPVIQRASKTMLPVSGIAPDAAGGVWFTSGGQLAYRSNDGSVAIELAHWPRGDFEPLCVSSLRDGSFWVGGAGGLYRVRPTGDRIAALAYFGAASTLEDTVVAAYVDHAGRTWVGTGAGVSVFDGRRWVSADTTSGLIWNDIDQNGIDGDPDGSIWIATGNGLSHVVRPDTLFDDGRPDVTLSDATLAGARLTDRRVAYTTGALTLQLGTTTYGSEGSITFRYKMAGVDEGWVDTSNGAVRYATVPPGHHTLVAYSYDALSRRASLPVRLDIRMSWPWWQRWWAEAAGVLVAVGLMYALWRARLRGLLRQRAVLERVVDERTREILAAQAALREQAEALRVQATRDGLTGLLNRTEIQRRLASDLSAGSSVGEVGVALLDIDHFKQINDRHGHLSGDHVLEEVGRRIRDVLRSSNYAGRYGGEEFMVVVDDRDGTGALQIIDLHTRIRDECFIACEEPIRVTCSVGVAWTRPTDKWESLVQRADAALYEAKRQGRDRVIEETPPPTVDGEGGEEAGQHGSSTARWKRDRRSGEA